MNPARVPITVPWAFRMRRAVPGHLVIHNGDLPEEDLTVVEGTPTTTVRRTIEDCYRTHLGPTFLRQAIEDGEREGYLRPDDDRELERLVLP